MWCRASVSSIQAGRRWALNGGPFGSKLVSNDYVESGVPVIRGINLPFDKRFSFDDSVFVTEEKADALISNNAHPGDVIFTQRGTLGQVGIIPLNSPYKRFVISQSQMKLTVDATKADAMWVYYYFKNPTTQAELINRASSSGVPHINLATLREFEITLPPLPTQRRSAEILSAYDDLIENNTRRIQILEEMARRIYEEWFVRFRFPGHENVTMVESELGSIPISWDINNVSSIVELKSGYAFKTSEFDQSGEYGLVTIKNVQDGAFIQDCSNRIGSLPNSMPAYCQLSDGDILLSLTGNVGRVCLVYGNKLVLNQRVSKLAPKESHYRAFLYCLFRSPSFHTRLENLANGVAQQNLSPVRTAELLIVIPDGEVLEQFENTVGSMLDSVVNLNLRNANLRRTRDLLLPKLISGEIDVSNLPEPVTD